MILIFLVLIPLFAFLAGMAFLKRTMLVKWINFTAHLAMLTLSIALLVKVSPGIVMKYQLGSWPAPYGITIAADLFSALMLVILSFVSFVVTIYANGYYRADHTKNSYYPLSMALMAGVNGVLMAADLFNLYVWFEVTLLSSFALSALGVRKKQLRGSIKYVTMNLVASFMFLAAIALIYSKTGSLNMAHIASILRNVDESVLINSSAMLFFIAICIKTAIFPFFYWLPASYHTLSLPVTVLFSALLTKSGVYLMIRFFSLLFIHDREFWHLLLMILAGLTMVTGVIMAASKFEIRQILSYHIISQIGYMIMGLAIFTPLGIAAAIFFTIHNIVSKTNAFLIGGLVNSICGSQNLAKTGDIYKMYPYLGLMFMITGFSLAGFPPLSGFFGKLALIDAGFRAKEWIISLVAIAVSLGTLFSMLKIWNEAFWKPMPAGVEPISRETPLTNQAPVWILTASIILLGVFNSPILELCHTAAKHLIDPSVYISTILNNVP